MDTVLVVVAAITKCHRLGGITNQNLSSHRAGGQKPEIKVSVSFSLPHADVPSSGLHIVVLHASVSTLPLFNV